MVFVRKKSIIYVVFKYVLFIIYVVAYNFNKPIYKLGSIKTPTNFGKRI